METCFSRRLETGDQRLEAEPTTGGVLLTLESGVLAKDVYLVLGDARFSNNFFDLLPGRPRTVLVEATMSPEEVRETLRIRTLAEIPREGLKSPPGG